MPECDEGETAPDNAHLERLQFAPVDGSARLPAPVTDDVDDVCEGRIAAGEEAAIITEAYLRNKVTGRDFLGVNSRHPRVEKLREGCKGKKCCGRLKHTRGRMDLNRRDIDRERQVTISNTHVMA